MSKFLLKIALLGCFLPWTLAICEPDCTGKEPGEKTEDPKNCHNYYICMTGGIPTHDPLPCGDNNHFDPSEGDCVGGGDCTDSCVLPPCHVTCTASVDIISDPFNCSVYRVCAGGNYIAEYHCPNDTPFFDGEYCQIDPDQCCSELCTPYCYPDVIQAPDPNDCRSFYICEAEGKPEQDHHFTCDDNEVFDFIVGRCVTGTSCRNLCSQKYW